MLEVDLHLALVLREGKLERGRGGALVKDVPVVAHEGREVILEVGTDEDFLELGDDLVEEEVLGGSAPV